MARANWAATTARSAAVAMVPGRRHHAAPAPGIHPPRRSDASGTRRYGFRSDDVHEPEESVFAVRLRRGSAASGCAAPCFDARLDALPPIRGQSAACAARRDDHAACVRWTVASTGPAGPGTTTTCHGPLVGITRRTRE